jgi:hypothetical protein
MIISASGLAVGGLYAGGAFDRGEVYPLPIAEARSRLELLELPPPLFNASGGIAVKDGERGDSFTWEVTAGSEQAAVFTAQLQAEGFARTRVTLDYARHNDDQDRSDRLLSTSFMRSYAETSFHEYVDAALERRSPDQNEAMKAFAANAAAHPEQIREVGAATEEIFKDVADQLKAAQAQGDFSQYIYSNSPRARMEAATRPSSDATRPSTRLPRE